MRFSSVPAHATPRPVVQRCDAPGDDSERELERVDLSYLKVFREREKSVTSNIEMPTCFRRVESAKPRSAHSTLAHTA